MESNTLIIIVTFNSGSFIEKCLESVVSSDFNGWFLAIIDNNSTDGTINRINQFINSSGKLNGTNFRLIKLARNIGFAAAVNHVVFGSLLKEQICTDNQHIKIKYLVLLNPDLYIEKKALGNLIIPFEKSASNHNRLKAGAAGGIIFDYDGKSILHAGGFFKDNFLTFHSRQGEIVPDMSMFNGMHQSDAGTMTEEAQYVTGALFATKLEYFISLGGFDAGYRPLYFEELDYCLKLKKLSLKIYVNPGSCAKHYEGGSVKKFSSRFYKYYHKNRIKCAVINYSCRDFFRLFIREELRWLRTDAAKQQTKALLYAYFFNLFFLIYNLFVKIRNNLIISKLISKSIFF